MHLAAPPKWRSVHVDQYVYLKRQTQDAMSCRRLAHICDVGSAKLVQLILSRTLKASLADAAEKSRLAVSFSYATLLLGYFSEIHVRLIGGT